MGGGRFSLSSPQKRNRDRRRLGVTNTMKASYLVIVLLLFSDVTLTSGFMEVFVGVAAYIYTLFEGDNLLPFDPAREQTLFHRLHYYRLLKYCHAFTRKHLLFSHVVYI